MIQIPVSSPTADAPLGPNPRPAASLPQTAVAGQSRVLYGGPNTGVSFIWHEFQVESGSENLQAIDTRNLHIYLNLTGEATFGERESLPTLTERTGGYLIAGRKPIQAWRKPWQKHAFLAVELSARFLRRTLGACDGALDRSVEAFLQNRATPTRFGGARRLTMEQEQLIAQVQAPPVPQGARALWYQSKVLQLIIDFLFDRQGDDELFCDRQKRIDRERVDRVISLLHRCLAEPPSRGEIGKAVGCSPFYLSRTFSRAVGMTIPQYLRRVRMEKAAELLASGKYNVTEAAMEVGYSSLSHFSQAFCQTIGCCPALYPLKAGR